MSLETGQPGVHRWTVESCLYICRRGRVSLNRLQEIVDDLATQIRCSVAVNDYALDLIVASVQVGPVDQYRVESIMNRHTATEVVELLRERGLLHRTEPFLFADEALPNMQTRMCVPLVETGISIAYLWVVLGDRSLTEVEVGVVQSSAHAILEALIAARDPNEDDLLADSRLLQSVLSADAFSAGYAISGLAVSGAVGNLKRATVVVFETIDHGFANARNTQTAHHSVHERARRTWARGTLLGVVDGKLTAVLPTDDAERFISRAEDALAGSDLNMRLVAIGSSANDDTSRGLHQTLEEAKFAAWVASCIDAVGRVARYQELGAFIALRTIPASEESVRLISAAAADLRSRDSKVYAETVLSLLNCAGDIQRTCAELSIHRTTLYYRLDRIREMTGAAIDEGWRRTSLHLGLLMGQLVDGGAST